MEEKKSYIIIINFIVYFNVRKYVTIQKFPIPHKIWQQPQNIKQEKIDCISEIKIIPLTEFYKQLTKSDIENESKPIFSPTLLCNFVGLISYKRGFICELRRNSSLIHVTHLFRNLQNKYIFVGNPTHYLVAISIYLKILLCLFTSTLDIAKKRWKSCFLFTADILQMTGARQLKQIIFVNILTWNITMPSAYKQAWSWPLFKFF